MSDEQEITAPLEPENLAAGWARKAGARPTFHTLVRFGAKTDLGQVRENNEDKFDWLEPDDPAILATKGRVYAVADGMGGHAAGQIASEIALNLFIRNYYADSDDDIEASLQQAVQAANGYLAEVARSIPGRNGMGTTLTAAVVRNDEMYVVQVGDSRLYLLRDGELRQVTEDHSWVQEQVRRGAMSREEAEASNLRNVITRSLGASPEVEADITALQVAPGDRCLLCSDGLSGMVGDDEIADIMAQHSPTVAVWSLIDRANAHGGKDNVTVMVLEVADVRPWPQEEGSLEAASKPTATLDAPPEPVAAEASAEPRPGAVRGFWRRLWPV